MVAIKAKISCPNCDKYICETEDLVVDEQGYSRTECDYCGAIIEIKYDLEVIDNGQRATAKTIQKISCNI